MDDICIPMGYAGGPYAAMAYAGGIEFCDEDAENEVIIEPNSNVRDLCQIRC